MENTILITGTSRGIGLALTRQLLALGHRVIATARHPEQSEALTQLQNKYSDSLRLEVLDVISDDSVTHLAQRLQETDTVLDVVINNAGIFHEAELPLEEASLERMREVLDVNALSPVRVTRALLPLMKHAAFPIVANVSSEIGSLAENSMHTGYGYCMSKAALNMFTTMLARSHPEVTCISLHPGWVKTDMGGAAAPIERDDSAAGLCAVLEKLSPEDTGRFFDFTGRELPW